MGTPGESQPDLRPGWQAQTNRGQDMDNNEGYSGAFYVMLIIGIVGVLGFFMVAAGAAGGL